ncbi:MAG: FKBP-type peptidyl-prolyl cis-trans isomerase [Candidatus Krumholzibacteriia bacterium]
MMMRNISAAAVAVILIGVLAGAGCQNDGGDQAGKTAFQEIMPGLSYVDSVMGDGAVVEADDFVEVHYTGWLYENGEKTTKFDSSVDRGLPFALLLGRSFVIQGWEKGIPGMHVGGKRTLLIGPEMAYGEQGRPPVIPPSSTLAFDIEVLSLPMLDIEILQQGDGPVAEPGDQISVHYSGWIWEGGQKGALFDTSLSRGEPYRFRLGAGMVIPGWDVGLEGMKVGTRAQLIIPPAMGYGAQGYGQSIPPNSTLVFEVELVSIENK